MFARWWSGNCDGKMIPWFRPTLPAPFSQNSENKNQSTEPHANPRNFHEKPTSSSSPPEDSSCCCGGELLLSSMLRERIRTRRGEVEESFRLAWENGRVDREKVLGTVQPFTKPDKTVEQTVQVDRRPPTLHTHQNPRPTNPTSTNGDHCFSPMV